MTAGVDTVLRWAGTIVLVAVALLGTAVVLRPHGALPAGGQRMPAGVPDLVGVVEAYDDDTIAVLTTTTGVRAVVVVPDTLVTEIDQPASPAALLPGRHVAVWAPHTLPGAPLYARSVLVWGPR